MFGVMSLASILLVGIWLFSDLGLRQSIIQSERGDDPVFLNTAWAVQIVRGVIMWLVAIVLAVVLFVMNHYQWINPKSAYAEPILPILIVVMCSGFLISGFDSTKMATASRRMLLKRVVIIQLMAQLVGTIVMVAWAWYAKSIWALVANTIVSSIVELVLSHYALPGQPNKWHWDKKAFHEIFHFGKWIFLTSLLGYLLNNGDRIILGGLIDARTLGLYSIACMLYGSLQEIIYKIGDGLGYPALSEVLRERPHDAQKVYYKIRRPLDIGTSILLGGLFAAGDLIIKLLYDERYDSSSYMLQILSIGLFMTRFRLDLNYFMAIGKPKLTVPIQIVNLLVLYVALPIAFSHNGMYGALWVIGAGNLLALPLIYYFKIKYGVCSFVEEIKYLPLIPVGYALGMLVSTINHHLGWIV